MEILRNSLIPIRIMRVGRLPARNDMKHRQGRMTLGLKEYIRLTVFG